MQTIQMTTREKLIQAIADVPEDLVEELFDFLLFIQTRRQNHKVLLTESLEEIVTHLRDEAQANGLTPEILATLLEDE